MAAAGELDIDSVHPQSSSSAPESGLRIGRFHFGPSALLRVALFATFVAYVQTITYSFVFDDALQIEMNPWIQSWRFWKSFFTGHVWSFGRAHVQGNYYRPMFLLWLTGNYSFFKLTPGWWHLTTIGAHVLATGLVYLLAARWLRDRWSGALAALLFGLNPLHIECVAWVSGVPEVMLTIFFVGALLAYQNWQQERKARWLAASVVLYTLAVLSKETALAFVPVLFCCAWMSSRSKRWRVACLHTLPYLVITAGYLAARHAVLSGFANESYPRPLSWVVLSWPGALWFYLRQLWWPFRLSIYYDFDLTRKLSVAAVVLPMIGSIGILGAMTWIARKARLALLAGVWIVVPLIPVLIGISVFQWNDYVHDRYLYLPSVMAAIVLAIAIKELCAWLVPAASAKAMLACGSIIAVVFGVGTIFQSGQWESDLALFSHAHERAPHNPLPFDYMARSLYGDGRVDASLQQYQELLTIWPDYWQGNYVLGMAYYQLGRYDESEQYLSRATQVWPRQFLRPEPAQFYYLGLVQQRKKDYGAAEQSLRKAVELRPEAPGYRYALAQVLKQRGAAAEAEEQLRLDTENRKAFEARQKGIPQVN